MVKFQVQKHKQHFSNSVSVTELYEKGNVCAWWIEGLYQGKTWTAHQILLLEMRITAECL